MQGLRASIRCTQGKPAHRRQSNRILKEKTRGRDRIDCRHPLDFVILDLFVPAFGSRRLYRIRISRPTLCSTAVRAAVSASACA